MKNTTLVIAAIFSFTTQLRTQNVAINNTGALPENTAILDLSSTTKGVLVPRMTTAQRFAIAFAANGLLVYDTDLKSFMFYDGGWNELNGGNKFWNKSSGSNQMYNGNSDSVVITPNGTVIPDAPLVVYNIDALTNTISNSLTIARATTGTAANGLGGSLLFRNQSSGGAQSLAARISAITENTGTNTHSLRLQSYSGGVPVNTIHMNATSVGIGTSSPDAGVRLDVNGATRSSAYKLSAPVTHFYSVDQSAFTSRNGTDVLSKSLGVGGVYVTGGSGTGIVAPVNLPHGAVITKLVARIDDTNGSQDLSVIFFTYSSLGFGNIASVTSSGSAGFAVYSTTTMNPAYSTVSNIESSYMIVATPTSGAWTSSDLTLKNVFIEYTIVEL